MDVTYLVILGIVIYFYITNEEFKEWSKGVWNWIVDKWNKL